MHFICPRLHRIPGPRLIGHPACRLQAGNRPPQASEFGKDRANVDRVLSIAPMPTASREGTADRLENALLCPVPDLARQRPELVAWEMPPSDQLCNLTNG